MVKGGGCPCTAESIHLKRIHSEKPGMRSFHFFPPTASTSAAHANTNIIYSSVQSSDVNPSAHPNQSAVNKSLPSVDNPVLSPDILLFHAYLKSVLSARAPSG